MRRMLVVFLTVCAWGLVPVGCARGGVECDCGGGPPRLYLDLKDPVPEGGSVEACFGDRCGVFLDLSTSDFDGRSKGSVPESSLGRWAEDRGQKVEVRIRDANDAIVHRETSAPRRDDICCGPFWTLRP